MTKNGHRDSLMFVLQICLLVALVVAALPAPDARAGAFVAPNVVVYRVGDGVATLSSAAAPVFLDEYTPTGTLSQTIPMPTAVAGSQRRLTGAGSAAAEGGITLSTDRRYLVLAGYDANVGTLTVASTLPAATNRVIGRVDANGNVDTSTAVTDWTGNARGAASDDGTRLWGISSNAGVRYTTFGSTVTSTQLSTTPTNIRTIRIASGQLYISSATGAFQGVSKVGNALPTTSGQTTTALPGMPTATGPSPYGFVLADLNGGVAGVDTLYLGDDRALGSGGGVTKWSYDGITWTRVITYNANIGLTAGVRGLTGIQTGPTTVTLYATTSDASTKLVKFTDDGSTLPTATALVTATANIAFRGVAMAPTNAGTYPTAITLQSAGATGAPDLTPVALVATLGAALAAVTFMRRRARA